MINLLKSLSDMMRGRPIRGERVYLRPPHRRDWRQWVELRAASRDFLTPWEPTWPRNALTRKAFLRRLRAYAIHSNADTGYTFFIFRASDHKLVGNISFNNVRRGVTQSCSVGYWTGQPYTRKGYMCEALSALLPVAFDVLKLHRVEAACLPNNVASKNLLMKIGFREEGFARQYLRIDGRWQDHVLFGMVNTDPRPVVASHPNAVAEPAPQRGKRVASAAAFAGTGARAKRA